MTNRDSSLEAAFVKLMALIYRNVVQPHYKTSKNEGYNVDIMLGPGRSMTSPATIIRRISAYSIDLHLIITVRLVFLCVVTDAISFVFFNNDPRVLISHSCNISDLISECTLRNPCVLLRHLHIYTCIFYDQIANWVNIKLKYSLNIKTDEVILWSTLFLEMSLVATWSNIIRPL
jgi:hypothetical protein